MIETVRLIAEVGVLVVIAGAVIYLAFKYFNNKIDIKRKVEVDITSHPFFSHMDLWIHRNIKKIEIEHKKKEAMVRRFLTIKFIVFKGVFEKLAVRLVSSEILADGQIEKLATEYTTKGIDEYNKQALEAGVPKIFLDGFDKWHKGHIDMFISNLQSISHSDFYDTNRDKTIAFLNMAMFVFGTTITDAEKTIKDMNGQIEKALDNIDK